MLLHWHTTNDVSHDPHSTHTHGKHCISNRSHVNFLSRFYLKMWMSAFSGIWIWRIAHRSMMGKTCRWSRKHQSIGGRKRSVILSSDSLFIDHQRLRCFSPSSLFFLTSLKSGRRATVREKIPCELHDNHSAKTPWAHHRSSSSSRCHRNFSYYTTISEWSLVRYEFVRNSWGQKCSPSLKLNYADPAESIICHNARHKIQ